MRFIAEIFYLTAALLFVTGLKRMSKPTTARSGNFISSFGMLLAIIGTLVHYHIIDWSYVLAGMIIGSVIGMILARVVKMTEMPQMVALLNGYGGLASLLVGYAEYNKQFRQVINPDIIHSIDLYTSITIFLTILVGAVTFSGSVIAWAKLKEVMRGKPILFRGQKFVNAFILAAAVAGGVVF
jgi:NAD(P) transhydrogenase subunit beta